MLAKYQYWNTPVKSCWWHGNISLDQSYKYQPRITPEITTRFFSIPIWSMVLLYMVCHGSHQYTSVVLAYIPAPWILQPQGISSRDSKHWPWRQRNRNKLEVPIPLFKAYIRPKFQGISPKFIWPKIWYLLTYLNFRILKFPLNIVKNKRTGLVPPRSVNSRLTDPDFRRLW